MMRPNQDDISRIQTLKIPICGESRNVHETANRSPGMAMGISINPQARFRNGKSVRSVKYAKNTATQIEIAVLNVASTAVLKNIE